MWPELINVAMYFFGVMKYIFELIGFIAQNRQDFIAIGYSRPSAVSSLASECGARIRSSLMFPFPKSVTLSN